MKKPLRTIASTAAVFIALLLSRQGLTAPRPPISVPVTPAGGPNLEEPTTTCLGAWWIVENGEGCRIEMEYRKTGDADWKKNMPMFRVRPGDTVQKTHDPELNPADSARLFAGSIVNLTPDTEYELRLRLVRLDGTADEKVLKSRTAAEPTDPPNLRVKHVVPGKGGGDGSEKNPYQGLAYAHSEARPGTVFLVHKGAYEGTFFVTRGGAPGKPVIWRSAGDGEAIIDGGGVGKYGVEVTRVRDVRFEGLSIRGFYMGMLLTDSSDLVIHRCHISDVKCGIYTNTDGREPMRRIFIADNLMEGSLPWGRGTIGADAEEWRGIQISGIGHEICYNRIRTFKDGVDTMTAKWCSAIDIHHNDVSEARDDGIEADFSERNVRIFMNRLTNVFQGISEQPIYGGPVYIFRNALYNVVAESFKLHHNGSPRYDIDWWPSGALLYHNTIVKKSEPFAVNSSQPVYNCVTRNNLLIGGGRRAMHFDPTMVDCDFDYDGYGGGPWEIFAKWNGVFYESFDEFKRKAPVERHATIVDPARAFLSRVQRPEDTRTVYEAKDADLRLAEGSEAVDAGTPLPGFNDGFAGKAPDLGAYELGQPLPHYGPRP